MQKFKRAIKPLVLLISLGGCQLPTDTVLENRFRDNTAAFEQLLELFKEDTHLWRIQSSRAEVFVPPSDIRRANASEWPTDRRSQYIDLMQRLLIQEMVREPSGEILMTTQTQPEGLLRHRFKGYAWNSKAPAPAETVASLDEIQKATPRGVQLHRRLYKPLNGSWHLFWDQQ